MPIVGIGIDIIEVERIKKAVKRFGKRFLERVYTEEEFKYCNSRKDPYPSFAVRFAAKEAFFKVLGKKVNWKSIEIAQGQRGRPFLRLKSKVTDLPENPSLHISLSHTQTYAVAAVVLEKKD